MLTYPGLKAAAALCGVRLVGVATDAAGILPDALKSACREHAPKALYLIPTIHNPTAVTMPPARRREVAEAIRAHHLTLFEDDAYGALAPETVPLAALIPERTYFAASLSKCIAPGLRVSFLLTPGRDAANAIISAQRASVQMPVSLPLRWCCAGCATAARTRSSRRYAPRPWRARSSRRTRLPATPTRRIRTDTMCGSNCRSGGAGRSSPRMCSARASRL